MHYRLNYGLSFKAGAYVYSQDLIYNNTNITASFPTLDNVDNSGNVLTATAPNGTAISTVINAISTDLAQINSDQEHQQFQGKLEFSNKSDASSSADTLKTFTPIADGENLVIVLDDNSINEIVASGVTTAAVDIELSKTPLPNAALVAGYALNNDTNDYANSHTASNVGITFTPGVFNQAGVFNGASYAVVPAVVDIGLDNYLISAWFKTSMTGLGVIATAMANSAQYIAINGGSINVYDGNDDITTSQTYNDDIWHHVVVVKEGIQKVYVDKINVLNGTTHADSATRTGQNLIGAYDTGTGVQLYFTGDIDQVMYMTTEGSTTQSDIDTLFSMTRDVYSMDTTATTAGEVPSRVYTDTKVSFEFDNGFQEAVATSNVYDIAATPILKTIRTYDAVTADVSSQTLQTKVIFKAKDNKMTELTGSIFKK